MLFRFREAQAADLGIMDAGRMRRPRVITEQTSIPACERWRGHVLKELSRKVSRIQESTLSDYQIRDLNDEINKLLREKHVWEVQIKNLGGPNYMRGATNLHDESGREIPGSRFSAKGYRYFGRAKELPGVKELLEAATKPAGPRASQQRGDDADGDGDRSARYFVDATYYGYGPDDEDSVLLAYESAKETEAAAHLAARAGADARPPRLGAPCPETPVTARRGTCPPSTRCNTSFSRGENGGSWTRSDRGAGTGKPKPW